MLPTGETELAGHAEQVAELVCPVAPEYLPEPQSVQFAAPSNEYLPAMQLMQVLATVAPIVVEYLPAVQSVQTIEAVPAAYLQPRAEAVEKGPTSSLFTHLKECCTTVERTCQASLDSGRAFSFQLTGVRPG